MKRRAGLIRRLGLVVALVALFGIVGAAPAFASDTGTITCQLVTMQGAPLAGNENQTIYVWYSHDGVRVPIASNVPNASGQVVFTGVPVGHSLIFSVSITAPYLSYTKTGVEAVAGADTTVLLHTPRAATVRGTVTAGGSPLVGAPVALWEHGKVQALSSTDALGNYTVYAPSGTYRVEFNERVHASVNTSAWAWSYWKSTTSWTKAKTITVTQETKTRAPSAVSFIDGSVTHGGILNAGVELTGVTSSNQVRIVSERSNENFATKLTDGGSGFATFLVPGKYRVGIYGPLDPVVHVQTIYWYRGEGRGPTTSESKATWITVGAVIDTIHFVDVPTS